MLRDSLGIVQLAADAQCAGVLRAVANINDMIAPKLIGMKVTDQAGLCLEASGLGVPA